MTTPSRAHYFQFSADEKAKVCRRLRDAGLSVADIAQRSGFSVRTVQRHLKRVDPPSAASSALPEESASVFSSVFTGIPCAEFSADEKTLVCRCLMARGLSVAQIAQRTQLSADTVARYLKTAEEPVAA